MKTVSGLVTVLVTDIDIAASDRERLNFLRETIYLSLFNKQVGFQKRSNRLTIDTLHRLRDGDMLLKTIKHTRNTYDAAGDRTFHQ
jgi:hypothetical protein